MLVETRSTILQKVDKELTHLTPQRRRDLQPAIDTIFEEAFQDAVTECIPEVRQALKDKFPLSNARIEASISKYATRSFFTGFKRLSRTSKWDFQWVNGWTTLLSLKMKCDKLGIDFEAEWDWFWQQTPLPLVEDHSQKELFLYARTRDPAEIIAAINLRVSVAVSFNQKV